MADWTTKTWVDRDVEYPGRRTESLVSGTTSTYDYSRTEGTVYTEGDLPDAPTMNDLEDRIETAFDSVDEEKADKLADIDEETGTTRTLALTDADTIINCTNTSDLTITVPLNSSVAFDTGTQIAVVQGSTGTVTFAGASGVTINSLDDALSIGGENSSVALLKTDTNEWLLVGSLG